jgi:ATP-dependent Clp protease ATP-binding subunit ClpB
MPPFNHFTTKAKEAIRRAHELAIERGQNHVNPMHLLAALTLQEDGTVIAILERLEVDVVLFTDSILEAIEGTEGATLLSPSYQIYLTPEFAQVLELSSKIAKEVKEEFVSTEHLLIAMMEVPGSAKELLHKFKIERISILRVLEEIKNTKSAEVSQPKKYRSLSKYTRNLTALARENKARKNKTKYKAR